MYIIKNLYSKEILKNFKSEYTCIIENLNEISLLVDKYVKKDNEKKEFDEKIENILSKCKNIKSIISLENLKNDNSCKLLDFKTSELINDDDLDKIINSLNFDSTYYNKNLLCIIVYEIFAKTFDLESIKIDKDKLKLFIVKVSEYYKNNPFHNFEHAVSVLQFSYLIISNMKISNYISNYRLFGLMIAAFVHDIDHPGHTNMFEIKKNSVLALIYNDNSILENHHCSTTFYIIGLSEIQLLEKLSIDEFKIVRETIIESIISTDMKYHFELVDNLVYNNYNFEDKKNEILFCKMIIHVADLSNQLRNFEIAYYMCQGLRKEFINQVNNEKKLNLSSQAHMENLSNDNNFYQCELEFCTNIIEPLIKIFCKYFPNFKFIHKNLKLNMDKWKKLLMNKLIKEDLFKYDYDDLSDHDDNKKEIYNENNNVY